MIKVLGGGSSRSLSLIRCRRQQRRITKSRKHEIFSSIQNTDRNLPKSVRVKSVRINVKKERKVIKTRKKDGKKGRKNTKEKKIRMAKIYGAEMNQREDYVWQKKS